MKWFKHLVASGDDPDIDDAISLFGADGYYVFFRTLEIMSREFDYKNPGKNEFSVVFFRKKFRISWGKVTKIINFFGQRNRIFFKVENGDKLGKVSLYCPKLKGLCDEHTRKTMSRNSGVTQELLRSDSAAEAEAEAEADTVTADGASASDKITNEIKTATNDLIRTCKALNYDFDVTGWLGVWLQKNGHPMAMLESIDKLTRRMIDKSKPRIKKPFGYIDHVMKILNGNYWEGASKQEADFINSGDISNDIKNLTNRIGG